MFLSYAMAAQGAQQPNILMNLAPLVFIFVIFYFLLIRPQRKKQQAHQKMVISLTKGAKVVTSGGIVGIIVKNNGEDMDVEITKDVVVKIKSHHITGIIENK